MTDKNLSKLPPVQQAMQSLDAAGVDFDLYDQVVIEPTSVSMQHAIDYARNNHFDAYCAVGGGSVMDTAKGRGGSKWLDLVNWLHFQVTVRSKASDSVNFSLNIWTATEIGKADHEFVEHKYFKHEKVHD